MARLVVFLLGVLVMASGLAWLADRPGNIDIEWEGYRGNLSVFHAVVIFAVLTALATLAWTILRQIWTSPASVGQFLNKRRQQRGLDALSSGMIAVGAGDRSGATRYALQARKSLPNEPLTHLLRAQAAQLTGDKATARRIFEAMLASPDTESLGLRGLYLEAMRVSETEAARQFAERAMRLNPKLSWPVEGLFDLQCKTSDWNGALETLAVGRKHGQVEKPVADRRRAVLLTAQAQALEGSDAEKALNLALEAHNLAPSLVPAAAIAGRILASRGSTPRAAKILQKTWARAPHPDLALAYAFARIGDSPRDRVDRVKQLAALTPQSIESPIAVASTAIEARDYAEARRALAPLLESRLTQRVATLMARVEGEEHGDKGRVREWLARAVNAPRDPAWTADGIVSDTWAPISPVSGTLDAFQWRVPVDELQAVEGEELTTRLESLVTLGAPISVVVPQSPAAEATSAASTADTAAPQAAATPPQRAPVRPQSAAPARTQAVDADVVSAPGDMTSAPVTRAEDASPDVAASSDVAPSSAPSASRSVLSAGDNVTKRDSKPAPAAVATSAATKASGKNESKGKRKGERPTAAAPASNHEIFISPRAPDDPGLDSEDEPASGTVGPYRAT